MQPGSGPPATGERWNVNMPAVVGVVVVFLVGVVVWVVATSAGDDTQDAGPGVATAAPAAPSTTSRSASVTGAPTLSPTPLPTTTTNTTPPPSTPAATASSPTQPSSTTAPPATAAPTTAAPATTSPGSDPDTVPGDLDIPGHPMRQPPCDGGFVTIVGSPVGEQATAEAVGAVLDQYPGTNYLRTDQSCPSLTQDVGGEPIYVVYFGPFVVASDACTARADGPADAYARSLSDQLDPDHSVDCA